MGNGLLSNSLETRLARLALVFMTLASTAYMAWRFLGVMASDGTGLLDYGITALYAALLAWVSFSFWVATLGFLVVLRRPRQATSSNASGEEETLPRTAILMPVYNEDPAGVFAGIRAMVESLEDTGSTRLFDFFVLSDTTDPEIWLQEERTWARLVSERRSGSRVFYRHRAQNHRRKAGNIADFCCRWGEHYAYMIVMDADSVMTGETLTEMVRRMEQDSTIGILQVPPTPVGRGSFFARMQQFAAQVYGPVFLEGYHLWAQCDGNYWGHNAIIRIKPFMEHCDLPTLPGEGPLGGEILSHDFVEAALMRRGGWKVCLAHDLGGSYEECPTTMLDYAQRDQRWCQGNLQHVKLLLAEGIHPASRIHMGMGVMSYLASPLWLLFLLLTLVQAALGQSFVGRTDSSGTAVLLFCLSMAMLLLPKLWGLLSLWQKPVRLAGHGGWTRASVSVLIETAASVLTAPIMMLLHTRFVISTLSGQKVVWNAQPREDRGVPLRDAVAIHYTHTLFGLAVGLALWYLTPDLLPWMSPILLGTGLSIVLSMCLGSAAWGRRLAGWKLLMIPEEIEEPPLLQAKQKELLRFKTDRSRLFDAVLYDPAFYALHVGILRATESRAAMSREQREAVERSLRSSDTRSLPAAVRRAVLNDAEAIEELHVLARSRLVHDRTSLLV
ncbi:MAG: glucans biosynthesis glucosyltransferase MdoH [Thermoguttaceae bacterium]